MHPKKAFATVLRAFALLSERGGTIPAVRDANRARVYAAELQVRSTMKRGAQGVDFFGSSLVLPAERVFADLVAAADYVAGVLEGRQVRAEFGALPPVAVRRRAGDAMAHYSRGVIHLPTTSDWALHELVVLHELAHHVVSIVEPAAASHGDRFVSVYLFLVATQMSDETALMLRGALEGQGLITA